MSKYHKSYSRTPNLITQIGATFTVLGRLIFRPKNQKFNHVQLLTQYAQIENLLHSGDAIHAEQSVIRADSFFDQIMKSVGGRGVAFADRLRSLKSRFDNNLYQEIWHAHKLRNQLAHEHIVVSINQARIALQTFRRATNKLGVF